jgi:hypothetical protein
MVTVAEFQCKIGDSIKVYPSLLQGSAMLGTTTDTFLESGRQANGVVYFEQDDSYGGNYPTPRNGRAKVRVIVSDVFGRKHKKSFWIPVVSLVEARKYNTSFGGTLEALRRNTVSPV